MTVRIIQGDVREELPKLQADYFDCIVTSPPYYGLRDYGTAKWEGGDPKCDHRIHIPQGTNSSSTLRPEGKPHHHLANENVSGLPYRNICGKCGARRIDAQIGLEPTLDEYLETMVAVCRELRRVLKPSGVFFLNIGDSYAANGPRSNNNGTGKTGLRRDGRDEVSRLISASKTKTIGMRLASIDIGGLKPKDLMLVPERLGIALQADGWWVRSHIIWAKPNPMPESVTDRPTSAHETIWMLTKSARYFWDGEAVNETSINAGRSFPMSDKSLSKGQSKGLCIPPTGNALKDSYSVKETRNIRNVWSVASHSFSGAHFATMPPEIAERCIKAGSSDRGCCPACGAPWVRVVEVERIPHPNPPGQAGGGRQFATGDLGPKSMFNTGLVPRSKTIGWQPSCKCRIAGLIECMTYTPIAARILDPFAGAGTTGLVADRLGRDATLIDLNTSYIDMAVNRIREDSPLFAKVAAE